MQWTDSSVVLYFVLFKIGHLEIRNYKTEWVANFKYLGVILNDDNSKQTDLQERMKNANRTYLCYKNFLKIKT